MNLIQLTGRICSCQAGTSAIFLWGLIDIWLCTFLSTLPVALAFQGKSWVWQADLKYLHRRAYGVCTFACRICTRLCVGVCTFVYGICKCLCVVYAHLCAAYVHVCVWVYTKRRHLVVPSYHFLCYSLDADSLVDLEARLASSHVLALLPSLSLTGLRSRVGGWVAMSGF